MTHLSILGSLLIPGIEFDSDKRVNALVTDPSNHCVVLFPGVDAVNLSDPDGVKELLRDSADGRADMNAVAESDHPNKRLVVFVIDGTWSQAKGMIRKSPNLMRLPKVRFDPATPSRYRIRKQPAPHCLSTLEAVHALIRLIDPEAPADTLLELFDSMVERQIGFGALNKLREHTKRPIVREGSR